MSKLQGMKRQAAAAVLAVALIGGLSVSRLHSAEAAIDTGGGKQALVAGFRDVVKATQPAVVSITSSKTVRTPSRLRQAPMPEFFGPFGDFFDFDNRRFDNRGGGEGEMPERRERGAGSGVIVRPDGHILTNDHVVNGASDIKVTLDNKREFAAKVVGTDPKTDIAVLKIEATNLPYLKLGDSGTVQVGDLVLALGNPYGIGQTVTMGIASAVGRSGLGIEDYEDFIQTDAAINPGNSGGALVNTRGELIGINVAILSRTGGNQGIGFAVPSNLAKQVMDQITTNGKVVRGWIGVAIQPVDAALAKAFQMKEPHGALVGNVDPQGPASKSGLKAGDIIVSLNGKKVEDPKALRMAVAMTKPGTPVTMGVFRAGAQQDVKMTLGEFPETGSERAESGQSRDVLRGLAVDNLTPQVASQLGLSPNMTGALVTSVTPGTAAAEAGLRRGDVIQEVNRKRVANVTEFRQAVDQGKGQPVLLLVNRGGSTLFVVVE
jgi:serine protease Do